MTTFLAPMFLKPTGLIEQRSMFPGEADGVLELRITSYITEAGERTSGLDAALIDAATIAWVYHRAFFAVFVELSANPRSNSMADQGSTSYSDYQIQNFKLLSDGFLAEFNGYVSAVAPTSNLRSYSVSHTIAYR